MLSDFISLLFPKCCIVSGEPLAKGEEYLSLSTVHKLPRYNVQTTNEKLTHKFSGLVKVEHVWAYYKYNKKSSVQKLLQQIKYKNRPEVGRLTGKWFGESIARLNPKIDIIVPIPLHPSKKRKRGYNQSDYIAEGMAEALQKEWLPDVMERTVNTATQTKKGRRERFENTSNIYRVSKPGKIVGKSVLVVDDVITTGATVGQCAELLIDAGSSGVSVAALAAAE